MQLAERYGDSRELFADLMGEMAATFGAKGLLQVSYAASGPCVACHRHGKTKCLDERIMQLSLFAVEHTLSSGAPFEEAMMVSYFCELNMHCVICMKPVPRAVLSSETPFAGMLGRVRVQLAWLPGVLQTRGVRAAQGHRSDS